jgi:serine/threonine protein kinase
VFRGRLKNVDEQIAIKAIQMQKLHINPPLKKMIETEEKALKTLRHENVIRLIDIIYTNKEIDLIYEYCDQGSLGKLLKANRFKEPDALKVLFDLSNALVALKTHGIVHRDIKPENILLKQGKIKLADFGLCMIGKPAMEDTVTHIGSFPFMAPESLINFNYEFKSDVYSLGIMM